jgi:hypothetical protein
MISILSDKITLYIKENSSIKTDDDLEKINYALQAVIGETFKITVVLGLFLVLGVVLAKRGKYTLRQLLPQIYFIKIF